VGDACSTDGLPRRVVKTEFNGDVGDSASDDEV